jgi:PAS domain S-box-containing protein
MSGSVEQIDLNSLVGTQCATTARLDVNVQHPPGPPAKAVIVPTNKEIALCEDDIIVSKTNLKGRITYANRTFIRFAGYTEAELLGQPHSIIRHPDMPRAVFKLLWDTIADRREIFAYVKNMAKSGDHYWVFAHVTPTCDQNNSINGYHSNRRCPSRDVVANTIAPLYAAILQEEKRHRNGQDALRAGSDFLVDLLRSKGVSYDELIFSL